jgi:16S rRNA (cytosine967-C5)-methyltransferase
MTAEPAEQAAGLEARRIAADVLEGVLQRKRPLDEQLDDKNVELATLEPRDRALVRALASTALRRLGTLRQLLGRYLERGLPAGAPRLETALIVGATQILWLDVPDHAAVDLAVQLVRDDRRAARYAGLANAVLRRVARDGRQLLAGLDTVALDTPDWLLTRWTSCYGRETARAIGLANGHEAAIDVSVKTAAEHWAAALGGRVVLPGSVRTAASGAVTQWTGYADGDWWVQDAAAALPARLLGDVADRTIAELCAAPGGKTAQLALAGASVVAVDRSPKRIERLRQNLARLRLTAETVVADATQWQAGPYDAVLLDAPCSSTGTIRRHPDIPWLKREADVAALADLQRRLIEQAAVLVRPGGFLVYCTCSLEPEEGSDIVRHLMSRNGDWHRHPITPREVHGHAEWLTAEGDLRTLPSHLPDPDPRMAGLDGFFAARLVKH